MGPELPMIDQEWDHNREVDEYVKPVCSCCKKNVHSMLSIIRKKIENKITNAI